MFYMALETRTTTTSASRILTGENAWILQLWNLYKYAFSNFMNTLNKNV